MEIKITEAARRLIGEKGYTVLTISQDFVGSCCTGGLSTVEIRPREPEKGTADQYDTCNAEGLRVYIKRNIVPKKDTGLTLTVTGWIKKSLTLSGVQIDVL